MPTLIAFLSFVFVIVPTNRYSVTSHEAQVSYYWLAYVNENADVILAKEELAGASFSLLSVGDAIMLSYPDMNRRYKVVDVQMYKATMPFSLKSGFVSEDGTVFSSEGLVKYMYVPGRLVLQTCFDNTSGRLFVIAEPIPERKVSKGR